MGREIRQVPPDWEHPRDTNGRYCPLYDNTYLGGIINHLVFYIKNLRWLGSFFEDWPSPQYCRPFWSKRKATHFQIYETVSEGTPTSPIFATREALADWLVEQGYSRRASDKFAKYGWVPSGIITNGRMYVNFEVGDLPDARETNDN